MAYGASFWFTRLMTRSSVTAGLLTKTPPLPAVLPPSTVTSCCHRSAPVAVSTAMTLPAPVLRNTQPPATIGVPLRSASPVEAPPVENAHFLVRRGAVDVERSPARGWVRVLERSWPNVGHSSGAVGAMQGA